MQPAAERMAQALAEVEISTPSLPVVANVRASALSDSELIRSLLVEQVTGVVRWRESVFYLAAEGVNEIWEVGAGKALSGMIRRIDRAIACQAISSPEDIAKLQGAAGA